MKNNSKSYSFLNQARSISLEPNRRSSNVGLGIISGIHRRRSDNKRQSQNHYIERRLSTSNDEIVTFSPKEAKLVGQAYNIEYACNQFIDKEEEKIDYTSIKDEQQSSITFKEICLVSPVHYSLCQNSRYCYRIVAKSNLDIQRMIVFKCKNQKERDYWMKEIRCAIKNVTDFLITEENSLKVNIQECRNLSAKNKYYCEIKLDDLIYARTSVKEMREICFWGEEFDLTGLSEIKLISITVWKLPRDREKERRPQIVSNVNISVSSVDKHCITEKWYSPSPICFPNLNENSSHSLIFSTACDVDCPPDSAQRGTKLPNQVRDSAPLLRIKSRYFPLKVLDTKYYSEILNFLKMDGVELFRELDVNLKAKYREELVFPMVQLAIRKQWMDEFLSELILRESKSCDINIILRGNSMATKAIECFLKIECGDYLHAVLGSLIRDIMHHHNDVEIDPARLSRMKQSVSISAIRKRNKILEKLVVKVLTSIFDSISNVPRRVLLVFNRIRDKLQNHESNSPGFTEKVISACFFLRLVCAAIMTPYLFQLLPDYSQNSNINRSFTLVAKCVQNVANFADIGDQKEVYMHSMVCFCRDYYGQMHAFLELISHYDENSTYESNDRNLLPNYDQIGFGMEMARLCYHIDFCLNTFTDENSTRLEIEAKNLISQLKNVETQISDATDTIEGKYKTRELTESRVAIENTIESSGYFSMNDFQINDSNQRNNRSADVLTNNPTKGSSHNLMLSRNAQDSAPSAHNANIKFKSYNYEEVLSLRKIIQLEKERLNLIRDVVAQYSGDKFRKVSANDLDLLDIENADVIASSRTNLQKYTAYATKCLGEVEQTADADTSSGILEKIIKMNSSLQILLVKYSKESKNNK